MKRILTGFAIISLLILQSCLKSEENVDFSDLGYITQILWPPIASASAADATGSGLTYFGAGALTYPASDEADTAMFIVSLAGTNSTMTKDLPITIGIDASKLQDNFSSDSITYEIMPDSDYVLPVTTGVIPAGKRLDTFYVVFYPSKFDPTKNFSLPITITAAPGTTVSSNFGTLYLHTIGNPLAGTYLQSFYRWNASADTTGPPNSTVFEDEPVTVAPVNPTTLLFPASYLESFTGTGIYLSFEPALTDFSASFEDASAVAAGGFTVLSGPVLIQSTIVGDASTGYKGSTFEFYLDVLNSTPANRKTIDIFTKQ